MVGADQRSDSDELRDLLSIELSEFRQFGDDRADGDWSDAFDRVQDFDFAGVGLIGMDSVCDLLFECFELFFQGFQHDIDGLANVFVTSLLRTILFRINEIQDLPPSFDEHSELHLFVRLSGLRRGPDDFTKSHDDFCIDGIGFLVASDTSGKVSHLARIHNSECNLVLMQSFDEQRFIATSGFHDDNGVGSVSDGFDPLRELLFVVANGLNIRARSLCGSWDGSGLK